MLPAPTPAAGLPQIANERRRMLIQRLAAQMASRSGSRAQSVGRNFGNSVDLRSGGSARFQLPFTLPNGRVRPAGFDPEPDALGLPQASPAAPPPPAGGGTTLNAPPPPAPDPITGAAAPPAPSQTLAQTLFSPPTGPVDVSGYNSDTPLAAAAPAASFAPPDPYTVMMQRVANLRAQRLGAAAGDAAWMV